MMTEETPEFGLADGLFVFVGAVSLWRAVGCGFRYNGVERQGLFGNIKGMR